MSHVELVHSKKRLILYLAKQNSKPMYKIRNHLKITNRRVNKICEDLNHAGILSFRTDNNGDKNVILDTKKIITKYERNKFVPDLIFLAVILSVGSIIALLTSITFGVGVLFSITALLGWILFKTAKTPDMKKIYYKKISP